MVTGTGIANLDDGGCHHIDPTPIIVEQFEE